MTSLERGLVNVLNAGGSFIIAQRTLISIHQAQSVALSDSNEELFKVFYVAFARLIEIGEITSDLKLANKPPKLTYSEKKVLAVLKSGGSVDYHDPQNWRWKKGTASVRDAEGNVIFNASKKNTLLPLSKKGYISAYTWQLH